MAAADSKEEVYDDADQSEFNAGIAALQRIHEAKKWLDALTDDSNVHQYIKSLKMLYKELHCMMNEEERKVHEPQWNKAREYRIIAFTRKLTVKEKEELEDWELALRDLDQIKGMNLPKKQDSRWSLGRR